MSRRYRTVYERHPVVLDTSGDVVLVQQQFGEEADINNIMAKYDRTGVLPQRDGAPFFGDFGDGLDYMDARTRVLEAQEAFGRLPARVRDRFGNDPAELLQFVRDPANHDEAVKLGLVGKPSAPAEGKAVDQGAPVRASGSVSGGSESPEASEVKKPVKGVQGAKPPARTIDT